MPREKFLSQMGESDPHVNYLSGVINIFFPKWIIR